MREVYDDWFADHTGTHLCSPRGGIPDALNGLPHYASQPGDLRRSSVFRTRLELDVLTVVPTAPAGVDSVQATVVLPLSLVPAESVLGQALAGSVWLHP